MKTINFLTSHFIPENTACTNRVLSLVQELAKHYKVNVICLSEKGIIQENTKIVYSENVMIYYVNQAAFDGKNFFKRALNEIKYIIKLIKISKTLPSDITLATSPYMFMIPLVGFGIRGTKLLDIRDIVWEYLDEKSVVKKVIKKVLTLIMKLGMKQFDHITVTNIYELNLLSNKYALSNNIDVIPNGIDRERYEKLITIKPATDISFTVTYVGNIGLAQNIKVLIDAAIQLPNVKILIIGDGIEADKLRNYVKNENVNNVEFTGKLAWDILEEYYEKSSVLYAQLDEKYISAMPSKLYEYASIGLPVIYGGVGQAKTFMKSLEHAVAIVPNNVNALVGAIKQKREEEVSIVSQRNRELIKEKFLREVAAKEVVRIVNELI
ncbi:glycosyltransferase family 4 protein [Sulfurovum sp. XGS-02]|uniref:glycosyltransferase family 4 protein n=1 Tax=Sulfurovum sp. XGS-02 TaxID=2925411 RepID=UPI00205F5D1B|nr:glycosyltransferase family 4 protein [Sulfurovum sp. XGS-02]UPT76863.1 glycosyltransferase family 4 protein [Sulfurovum sp. XGS-02]